MDIKKPYEIGVMTKEDYDYLASGMSKKGREQFDKDTFDGDPNHLMSLGATGWHKKKNENDKQHGIPPMEKDPAPWWERYGKEGFPD